jgi:hypothetical protein
MRVSESRAAAVNLCIPRIHALRERMVQSRFYVLFVAKKVGDRRFAPKR